LALGPSAALAHHEILPPLLNPADLAREAPAWLLSAILHMLVLIVLALLFVVQHHPERFVLEMDARDGGEDLLAGDFDVPLEMDDPLADSAAMATDQIVQVESNVELTEADPIPLATTGEVAAASAPAIQSLLSGREEGLREALLMAYGGNAGTQESVAGALRWLARNQDRRTGLWSLAGPYANGRSGVDNKNAATGMALLAFQGAGYTPDGDPKDPFTSVVRRGWTALLKRQDPSGFLFQEGAAHDRLYTHAICTIALCELYAMTKDSLYHEPAQRAVNYCAEIQSPEGGWRYTPGVDSDLSVTGWFVMALQSARMGGLAVSTTTLERVSNYLDIVSRDGGSQYAYHTSQPSRLSMTAEGLLCRQYLGWKHDDRRLKKGTEILLRTLPSWERDSRNCYYWYYATQVCHHMEGEYWQTWNREMRTLLPENQVREGKERGSWDPGGDEWGSRGGRLMVTCLHTYMLEVYYRHLPIYQLHLMGGN
ncbi:MAG: terpene cyclase/mutase family protein, partial [Planctomycetales bacterium]|nr:terpene cyclase/mutase family protein [Planctomycetales bacterium]